jgi:hypothetical protein
VEIVGKEARRGDQGLKTEGSSVLVNEGMAKGNDKKTYTSEDISSKRSVLEDRLIGGLDDKYDDSVQKLIDIGKEKGYLLYDEVSDLLPPEIGASAEDLDDLFSAFATAGIEVIATDDQNFAALDKIPSEKKFNTEANEEGIELDLTSGALEKATDPVRMYLREMATVPLLTRAGEVEIAKRIERGQLKWPVLSSCARRSMSLPTAHGGSAPGPSCTISNSAREARIITRPFVLSPTNGFALCSGAGRIACLTTTAST